jgi:predicted enzyme related to lactoylglutathione lyase
VCDDIDAMRERVESRGATLLVDGVAELAGLRTTWFRDPFGVVFILMQKRDLSRPYYRQY